jgi:hypothetical protein
MLELNVSGFIDVSGSTMNGNCVYSRCSKTGAELSVAVNPLHCTQRSRPIDQADPLNGAVYKAQKNGAELAQSTVNSLTAFVSLVVVYEVRRGSARTPGQPQTLALLLHCGNWLAAGWVAHPLESAPFARRTPRADTGRSEVNWPSR